MVDWIILNNGNMGIRDTNKLIGDIFINDGDENQNLTKWPTGKWHLIKLSDYGIPPDAKAVDVVGRLAVTSGYFQDIVEVEVSFKKPSLKNPKLKDVDDIHTQYCMQVMTNHNVSQREIVTTTIIPENGLIHFGWNHKPIPAFKYPTTCSVGVNLVFNKWYR